MHVETLPKAGELPKAGGMLFKSETTITGLADFFSRLNISLGVFSESFIRIAKVFLAQAEGFIALAEGFIALVEGSRARVKGLLWSAKKGGRQPQHKEPHVEGSQCFISNGHCFHVATVGEIFNNLKYSLLIPLFFFGLNEFPAFVPCTQKSERGNPKLLSDD